MSVKSYCCCVQEGCGDQYDEYGISLGPFDLHMVRVSTVEEGDYAIRECGQCFGTGEPYAPGKTEKELLARVAKLEKQLQEAREAAKKRKK